MKPTVPSPLPSSLRKSLLWASVCSLGGCAGAPVVPLGGSYFPAWLLCALVGCMAALLAYALLARMDVLAQMPVPLLVCLGIGYLAGAGLWLTWMGA